MRLYRIMLRTLAVIATLILGLSIAEPVMRAQNDGMIKGSVMDQDGEPLVGASIIVAGTQRWTLTDDFGSFSIYASEDEVLEVAFMGYVSQSVKVGKRNVYNITMQSDNKLDEVVFIGYGTVAKKDVTGSVGMVNMKDIRDVPVNSVDKALQGRIAGMDVMSTTGEPGATTTIRIRGTRSITASNEPLIILDGVVDAIHDLNDVNADDIQSITVLKDASSTAIYGSRGSNGVILITTKQGTGTKDKTNVTFKAEAGISMLPSNLDIMNATEFAMFRNDLAAFGSDTNNTDIDWTTAIANSVYSDPYSLGEGTNWIKEITRVAPYQNYSLTLSGLGDKGSYYASFAYNNNQGIIKNSGEEKITGRISIDRQIFKWLKVGYKGSYTWRYTNMNKASIGGTAYYSAAMYLSPLLSTSDNYNPLYNNGQKIDNPIAKINNYTHYYDRHSNSHAFTAKVTPVKNVELNSTFSYYHYNRAQYRYYPSTMPSKEEGEGGEAYRADWQEHSLSSETTATYRFKSGKHYFDVLGGVSLYTYKSHSFTLSGSGYQDDAVLWNNMNAVLDKETYSASTSLTQKNKTSVYARANYNFDSTYYITLTGRYDGASNFAANHKWAFFPSVALKWNIANENFMDKLSMIEDSSIRLSIGTTGNDAISAYQSLANLSSTTSGYLFDGSQPVAFYRSRLDSPDLKWEKTMVANLALDWSMMDGKLSFTVEAYYSKTRDLLLSLAVPYQTGYTSRLTNIGSTSNKGIEFTLHSENIIRKNFSWSTDFTISHNKQMVDDIGTEEYVSTYNSPGNNSYMIYGYMAGYPLNALWGFKYGGTWKSSEEIAENEITKTYVSQSTSLGSPRYYDINHDGVLSQEDLIYQGNADPYLYGGLQNNFHLYGFDIGIYFTYSLGGKMYNYSEFYMAGSIYTNQYRYMLNAWHPTRNPDSDIPRAGGKVDAALPSDFMIHDASFLRLKNVSISYTFDISNKWLKNIVLTASGENLYLWKKYNGFDPDVSTSTTSSTLRRLDIGAYPKARTIVFSVKFSY